MKKYLLLPLFMLACAETFATLYYIPDANFENKLISLGYGSCISNDSIDSTCPLVANATSLDISNSNIHDLGGILAFTSLDTLVSEFNLLYNAGNIILPSTLTWLDIQGAQCGSFLTQWPPSLVYLNCTFFNYATLPPLPSTLVILRCEASSLTSLPSLPNGIEEIYCGANYNLSVLPPLPSTLKILDCHQCAFTALSNLPSGLVSLNCNLNQLTTLPVLPASLASLQCYYNQITSLPTLPSGLQALSCHHNQLSTLSGLPGPLWYLDASYNQLTSISNFPSGVSECYISNNLLTSLPPLSLSQGMYLFCDYNQLTAFPPLNQVGLLRANNNLLTSLPALPSTLWYLKVDSNFISCLPPLPNTLRRLEGLGGGYSCLPNLPDSLQLLTGPSQVCTAPCILLPAVSGTVYDDLNLNAVRDPNETGHPNIIVEVQPGNYFGMTDSQGKFNVAVDDSLSLTITPHVPAYYASVPVSLPANPISIGDVDSLNDFALQPAGNIPDLRISLQGLPVVNPGDTYTYFLQITNQGTVSQPAMAKVLPDTLFNFSNASPPPDNIIGDTLIWNIDTLAPGGIETFTITGTISSFTGGLSSDTFYAFAVSPLVEATPSDNADTLIQILGSPGVINQKYVSPAGDILVSQVQSGQWMEYAIFFQNQSGETVSDIMVIDSLDANLDLSTIHVIASSHPCIFSVYQGVARFEFQNINLPDSAANPGACYGFVTFGIMPDTFLTAGSLFENDAVVNFDTGYSINTNTVTTHVSTTINISKLSEDFISVYPNPSNGVVYFSVHEKTGTLSVTLFDATGKKIFERKTAQQKINAIDFNEYHLSPGFYILEIVSDEGRMVGSAGISVIR